MSRRMLGSCALLALAVLGVRAQEPDQDAPVLFRSGVELVQLDVSVLDRDRHPVRGLTADDFTVFEDGTARPIVSFTEVDLPAPAPPPAAAAWVRDVAPDVASNARTDGGRLVVILLDRSVPVGQPTVTAREIARAAVEELGPNDLAAVLFTGVGVPQNFTADRRLLLRAIDTADPSTAPSQDAGDTETSQEVDAFNSASGAGSMQHGGCYCGLCVPETITHVAETLRDVPRRKSLLFIGAAMAFQSTEMDCSFRLDDARKKMMRALDLANVTVHSFDPVGLEVVSPAARVSSPTRNRAGRSLTDQVASSLTANLSRQGSLEVLPDRTGGRTVINANEPQRTMAAVFEESSSYYLIAFEAGDSTPGVEHQVEVKTTRRGARVQTRRRFALEDDEATGAPAGDGVPAAVIESLARATAGARPVADIPLDLTVAPFAVPGSARGVDLIVTLGMRYPVLPAPGGAAGTRREEIRVLAGAFDRYAQLRANDERSLVVSLAADARGDLPVESFSRLSVEPGSFEVRVGASAASGAPSGSVFTYVDVPAFRRARLSLSGLVLAAEPGWPAATGDVIAGRLPVTPTARRTFTRGDRVTAFARAYQGGDGPLRAATATIRLTTATGLVALERTLPLTAAAFADDRSADITVALPVSNLNPGEHLLTVDVSAGDDQTGRNLRFTVR